ncbi:MAG: sulfite exporter TauE/SafE family protein [Patescibacteria group bacterium]
MKKHTPATTAHTFHVYEMHCNACVALIESELGNVHGVSKVVAHLATNTVEVVGDFGDKTPEHVARELSEVLKPHNYIISLEKRSRPVKWSDFKIAAPVAGVFIALFVALEKSGAVNLATTSGDVGYGTAFVIGLIASVSTCMAVVGGIVLSMSANFAKEGDKVRPQMLFHVGRLVSFVVLGGAIGALGSAFQLGATSTLVLSFIVALVLLILGINLLDVFPWAKKLQPIMPSFVGRRVHGLKNVNHTLTPFLVGVATFFLPCGFTQSMQIYTLTTGSFVTGALTMGAFALGTLPVLALLSFSSLGIHKKAQSGVFFKTAGLVVIFFGVFNLFNVLISAGFIAPLNLGTSKNQTTELGQISTNVSVIDGKQIITMKAKGGYTPSRTTANAGLPTVLQVETDSTFDCSSAFTIPSLKISKNLPPSGVTAIEIPPQKAGTVLDGRCVMGTYSFVLKFK